MSSYNCHQYCDGRFHYDAKIDEWTETTVDFEPTPDGNMLCNICSYSFATDHDFAIHENGHKHQRWLKLKKACEIGYYDPNDSDVKEGYSSDDTLPPPKMETKCPDCGKEKEDFRHQTCKQCYQAKVEKKKVDEKEVD